LFSVGYKAISKRGERTLPVAPADIANPR